MTDEEYVFDLALRIKRAEIAFASLPARKAGPVSPTAEQTFVEMRDRLMSLRVEYKRFGDRLPIYMIRGAVVSRILHIVLVQDINTYAVQLRRWIPIATSDFQIDVAKAILPPELFPNSYRSTLRNEPGTLLDFQTNNVRTPCVSPQQGIREFEALLELVPKGLHVEAYPARRPLPPTMKDLQLDDAIRSR